MSERPIADHISTRRSFLTSVGALLAAGLVSSDLVARAAGPTTVARRVRSARGLALGPDDFAFAPGLVYFQTGSLGPTPRPVMERTIAAWKLELDPVFYRYGPHEHAMDDVRAKGRRSSAARPRSSFSPTALPKE